MEENNYQNKCFFCEHPLLKCILTGLLIFLGAFCAFYVVSDWHFKRMTDPIYQMRKFDKDILRHERQLENSFKKDFKKHISRNSAQFIHVEQMPNAYRIVIDLKPFDNDEKNVDVKVEGNSLFVNASGVRNSGNQKEIVKYNQTFGFGDDIKAEKITKVREGDNYIITVPFE